MTLKEALRLYFEENGFAADGGYGAAWVDFSLGPIPFPFPNTPQRRAAVRFHDLHHLVTAYRTDFRGELEISAWEIGSGCRNQSAAWVLNLGGMGGGMVLAPFRSLRAFVRGRNSDNFYGESYDEHLLATPVVEARRLPCRHHRRPGVVDASGAGGLTRGPTVLLPQFSDGGIPSDRRIAARNGPGTIARRRCCVA